MLKHLTRFDIFALLLFGVLWTYLTGRVFLVEPIHDELATLFHYIDYNTIVGRNMITDTILDANNHLLNSFLGKICYSLFGDHIWAIRLPNLLSFILFFYAIYKIALLLRNDLLKYTFVVGSTCIPYVLDYFAYCRGYGMSMAFLMMGVYWFIQLAKNYSHRYMIFMAILLILGIYANLNLVITAMMMFTFIGIKLLISAFQDKNFKSFVVFCMISLVTAGLLLFAVYFSFLLKISGALYYGNKDGLWLTTGATLSESILFSKSLIIKYTLIVLIVLIVAHTIYFWVSKKSLAFFQNPATLFTGLLLGNLIAIELMRWLMDVNYPEDRVGMHLIFFFVGTLIFILDEYALLTSLSLVFLIFPIVGWKHFNFVSSIFSPNDRIEKQDFDAYLQQIKPDKSANIYHTQRLAYAYHVRENNPTNFIVPGIFNRNLNYDEEIVSSLSDSVIKEKSKGYKLIRQNNRTWFELLQRKKQYTWKTVAENATQQTLSLSDKFYNIIDSAWVNYKDKRVKYVLEYTVNTPDLRRETLILVVDKTTKNAERNYESFKLNWAAGKHKTYTFHKVIEFNPSEIEDLRVYLYNPNELNYTILKRAIVLKIN